MNKQFLINRIMEMKLDAENKRTIAEIDGNKFGERYHSGRIESFLGIIGLLQAEPDDLERLREFKKKGIAVIQAYDNFAGNLEFDVAGLDDFQGAINDLETVLLGTGGAEADEPDPEEAMIVETIIGDPVDNG